jgi:hypothetical protein
MWSRPFGGAGVALAWTGSVVLGALALTESFQELPAAAGAYVAAWWVLGLEQR